MRKQNTQLNAKKGLIKKIRPFLLKIYIYFLMYETTIIRPFLLEKEHTLKEMVSKNFFEDQFVPIVVIFLKNKLCIQILLLQEF